MTRFNLEAFQPLDSEEKALMESIESGEWQPVENIEREKEKALKAARATLLLKVRPNLKFFRTNSKPASVTSNIR